MRGVWLLLAVAGLAVGLLTGARYVSTAGAYDGTYQGTLNYSASVPGSGTQSGSTSISFTVTDGAISGSFGPVPQYNTVGFSGTVNSSGSGSASAAYSCSLSMQFSSSGSVSGSVGGCTDQGGTASGSFSATRTSAPPPPPTTTTVPTTSTTTPTEPVPTTPAPKPPNPTSNKETALAQVERGKATIKHADGTTGPLTKSTRIETGDTISTGANGRVVLSFADGSKIELSSNSSFQFEGVSQQTLTFKELLGKILYRLQRGRYQVRTPTACACVRGTAFSLETRPGWTRIRVLVHSVDFYNLTGKRKHVLVKAGFESIVRGSSPPTSPKRF